MIRCAWLVLALSAAAAVPLAAQVPVRPTRPSATRDTSRAGRDTLRARGDTSKADTLAKANFAEPDSVMQRLLKTPGYNVTRYQGEVIAFDALTRAMQLTTRAMVQRDSQLVKSDTIRYTGTGSDITVGSDPSKRGNVFVTTGQAPLLSSGAAKYNIASRRANVTGVKTQIPQSGQELTITGNKVTVVAAKDTLKSKDDATYYVQGGTVTACQDSIPDYYFKAGEIKRTGSFVVARPAVLYIGDVPVLWLPFLFQDIRSGRHSGLIAPSIGVSDFIRNSKAYRRQIEGLGYYVAFNEYIDAEASLDWRSNAGAFEQNDPGYTNYNGELRYKWLDRFVTGNVAVRHTQLGSATNNSLTWGHAQSFSRNSSFTMNLNLVKSTQIQRITTINPIAAIATIASQANYQQKIGPAQISLGGSQKQYTGRSELDRTFPTLSLTTSPLNIASWLSWTPSVNYTSQQNLGIDQPSDLGLLFRTGKTKAGVDTVFTDTLHRSARTSSLQFDTPIQVFGYTLGNSVSISSALNDFPERQVVTDVTTGVETTRIYTQTYNSQVNWNPIFTLPALAQNNFNLSTSLGLSNVDGGPLFVRNERTGGRWVHQTKRPTFGLSASPALFGLFSGIGPFQRFRHSIQPTLGYSYSPAADISNAYLAAVGRTKFNKTTGDTTGYLGALAQSALSFGLSTNIEGKLRSKSDSNPDDGEKIKLLTMTFSPFNYDFERAAATHSRIRGLTTESFNSTLRSDLVPGLDVGVNYSLFEGSTLSDTAKFKPFRTGITAAFQFSNTANPFAVFTRLFGTAVPLSDPGADRNTPTADDRYAREVASQPVAGRASRTGAYIPNPGRGWQVSLNYTSSRQRPLVGATNSILVDPTTKCAFLNTVATRLQYDACVAQAYANPARENPITSGLVGAPTFIQPPTSSLGSNISLNLTEHWAATWQTQYDFVLHDFASQIVSLQRDLHDWRAIFAFTKAPNGSFAFSFNISLKAEPELKFDYHKSTYRNEGLQ